MAAKPITAAAIARPVSKPLTDLAAGRGATAGAGRTADGAGARGAAAGAEVAGRGGGGAPCAPEVGGRGGAAGPGGGGGGTTPACAAAG
jgi:hypothetical protein